MVKSLRWRLQLWHALILLGAIVGFGAMLQFSLRQSKFQEIDGDLMAAGRVIEGGLRGLPREILEGRGLARIREERPPRDRFPPEGPPPGGDTPRSRGNPEIEGPPREPPDRGGPLDLRGPPFDRGPGRRQPPPPRDHLERAVRLPNSFVERFANSETPPFFAVWCQNGEILKAADNLPKSSHPLATHPRNDGEARQRGAIREIVLFGPEQTQIVVGRSIERELAEFSRLRWQLWGTGGIVLAVGLAGGWWLSGRAVQPIALMSASAGSITATNLSQRIDAAGVDNELGELAKILNAMLDRIERAFAQQVQFTADASHELRTPLAIIMSHAELALARPRSTDEYRSALEAALRSSRRMKLLVEELLTLARSDAGKLQLDRRECDLATLVTEAAALLAPLAEEHQVQVETTGGPAPLLADSRQLSQVVHNLLTNAIIYNHPSGKVSITTKIEVTDALLVVNDTGIGISQADLPRLFDRFFRVNQARTRERGGSGLGLAICQSIVEAHGGTITATSQLDVGTTMTVRIPRTSP